MDSRLTELTRWVQQLPGLVDADITPVSGDASFRRYFRAATDTTTYIVMDAPPDKEDCRPFIALAQHWHAHGVPVPALMAQNLSDGFLLLEDFGDQQYLPALNPASVEAMYGCALEALVHLQGVSAPADYPLPPYDDALLDREMALFRDWLVCQKLGLHLSAGEEALLTETFACLRATALEQPRVTVHRDYHSRNLMLRPQGGLGILDFQDAVQGPVTYDLVSLLKDCYIRWPEADISRWCEQFRLQSAANGLHDAGPTQFRRWFERMGMQRHLKAAGIFARLSLRDGKHGYLADIPRTLSYLADACALDPDLQAFQSWLSQRVLPAVQPWAPGAPA